MRCVLRGVSPTTFVPERCADNAAQCLRVHPGTAVSAEHLCGEEPLAVCCVKRKDPWDLGEATSRELGKLFNEMFGSDSGKFLVLGSMFPNFTERSTARPRLSQHLFESQPGWGASAGGDHMGGWGWAHAAQIGGFPSLHELTTSDHGET